MSNERYVDNLNAATIFGQVTGASLQGEIQSRGILGGITIGGVNQTIYQDVAPATRDRIGGIIVGEHLEVTEDGLLSVIVTGSVDEDNTHPISAAAVYTEVGNINALLHGI